MRELTFLSGSSLLVWGSKLYLASACPSLKMAAVLASSSDINTCTNHPLSIEYSLPGLQPEGTDLNIVHGEDAHSAMVLPLAPILVDHTQHDDGVTFTESKLPA